MCVLAGGGLKQTGGGGKSADPLSLSLSPKSNRGSAARASLA